MLLDDLPIKYNDLFRKIKNNKKTNFFVYLLTSNFVITSDKKKQIHSFFFSSRSLTVHLLQLNMMMMYVDNVSNLTLFH
jgi:hypothetical protein